jgi:putative PIN family toxin of toxin-antitoxin system
LIKVVIDPGVLISGLIAPGCPPRALLRLWKEGAFSIVVSAALLDELLAALLHPKLRRYVTEKEAARFVETIRHAAIPVDDPPGVEALSRDPEDDYLIALARASDAHALVSGDRDLTSLRDLRPPVLTPRVFYDSLVGP